jgi:hydroxymethylpyrimidine/phosphomethylpyrimidine kinase
MPPKALSIAGSDPSGGAGIQADLKTFHQFGVYGEAAITLVTVQNTQTVARVELLPPDLVAQQIAAVLNDVPPNAIKTGALGSATIVDAVAEVLKNSEIPLIVDPVMISKHGVPLMAEEARQTVVTALFPLATLVTPNLHEAEALVGFSVQTLEDMQRAGESLLGSGCRAVLIKGGHLSGDAVDLLVAEKQIRQFASPRVDTPHTHGTGCTYSAAITALVATGVDLSIAVEQAKRYISRAIATNPGFGSGNGPVNHFAAVD